MATTIRPLVGQVSVQDLALYLRNFIQHAEDTGAGKSLANLGHDSRARPTRKPNERVAHHARSTAAARRGAHQTMLSELRQFGRDATVMDMVLDHRLLICVADQPADGRCRSPVPRNYAPRCQADIDACWAQQEERREFVSSTMSKNIKPAVSAERSTTAWSPNLDGDEVWDSAS